MLCLPCYNHLMTLSVIVLSRNVASEIIPTLKSARFAPEIILVDTGSTDDTLKVARPYVHKIIKTSGQDFAAWRNLGASAATSDWLLYLDSDERLPKPLAEEILSTINNPKHQA